MDNTQENLDYLNHVADVQLVLIIEEYEGMNLKEGVFGNNLLVVPFQFYCQTKTVTLPLLNISFINLFLHFTHLSNIMGSPF